MSALYKPPLAVHMIWHPSDKNMAAPILEASLKYLSRDVARPFSRNLNVPLFLCSSNSPSISPGIFPRELAARNVLFIFTSINTRGHDSWNNFIRFLPNMKSLRIVPVALTHEGLGHGEEGSLKSLNIIRAYEWQNSSMWQHVILSMAHEIYRHGLVEINKVDKGKSSSIKLFLSHAKSRDIGRLHAESIMHFIDNTNMSRFFDAIDISPGFKFNEEIEKHIEESTVLLIGSDAYSSRYWCQREVLCAKQNHRPIIAVNCLENYEDRIFPAGSNVPCVHVSPDTPLSESDILRILTAAILETIRYHHALDSLRYYQLQKWIETDCALVSRPPEISELLTLKEGGKIKKICHPEPPIYSEEANWHNKLGIDAFTPLWNRSEDNLLSNLRVGVSISDVPNDGYGENHLPVSQSVRFAQDLARHILARSGTLIYGGDLRKDGFTEFILNEAIALKNRLNTDEVHVENCLAWPIYKEDKEMVAWRSNYRAVMKTVESAIPDDIASDIDKDTYLPPSTPQNKYYWSRCLTAMRLNSIDSSDVRICAGGRLFDYSGKMPGVLEEILIAIEKKKPLFLLGAFGGVVGDICKVLRGEPYPASLTESWQLTHNVGYVDLQMIARAQGMHADYKLVKTTLLGIDLPKLYKSAGLDKRSYLRLMQSPFVDECVYLIKQGLKKLAGSET
ncbi:MAG: TIR domain-containing protein [Syntrophorhabdaceae bacterium]